MFQWVSFTNHTRMTSARANFACYWLRKYSQQAPYASETVGTNRWNELIRQNWFRIQDRIMGSWERDAKLILAIIHDNPDDFYDIQSIMHEMIYNDVIGKHTAISE